MPFVSKTGSSRSQSTFHAHQDSNPWRRITVTSNSLGADLWFNRSCQLWWMPFTCPLISFHLKKKMQPLTTITTESSTRLSLLTKWASMFRPWWMGRESLLYPICYKTLNIYNLYFETFAILVRCQFRILLRVESKSKSQWISNFSELW